MKLEKFEGLKRNEISSIEFTHELLKQSGKITAFNDLLLAVQEFYGYSDKELEDNMVWYYTHLNIDGRFISLGDNTWGLRAWYAIDEIDEEIISSMEEDELPRRRQKTNIAFADDGDMIDYNADDPEDSDDYLDEDEDDEDDDDDGLQGLAPVVEEDEDEEEELTAYETDLSQLGDDDIEEVELDEGDDEEDEEEFEEE